MQFEYKPLELDAEEMKLALDALVVFTEPIARVEGVIIYGKLRQRIRARHTKAIAELFLYIRCAKDRDKLLKKLSEINDRLKEFETNQHISRGWQLDRKKNRRSEG